MKFNLLIVDDEYFIRQRIKKIIPWEELNLNFSGEAANGLEAVKILKEKPIDIVLLDIKMPKMTGLEVAEYISKHYPLTKVIILSGHNDFQFAHSALKQGVLDYLLKPVDVNSLKLTLEECINKLLISKNQHKKMLSYYHFEKSLHLNNLLNGKMNLDEFIKSYPEMADLSHALYLGAFIHEEGDSTMNDLIEKLKLAGFDCEYFKELDYTYTIQLFFKSKGDLSNLGSLLNQVITDAIPYTFITIGDMFPIHNDWLPHYKRVLYSLNQRYFSPSSNLHIEYRQAPKENITIDLSKIRQRIVFLLNNKHMDDFKLLMDKLFDDIKKNKDVDYLHLIVTEIFITYNIYYHHLVTFNHNIREFVSMLIDEEHKLNTLKTTVISYGIQCMDENKSSPSDVILSKKIIEYIMESYTDPNLTVTEIADFFQLNPSYLGSLFKKVNNMSILQYITFVRMEASKKLLEKNQYKISDVSEKVGYSDAFYFSKRFKKMYGYSPSDYSLRSNR